MPHLSSPVVNALTVDVEDYFQVSAFERVIDPAQWSASESRVASNTDRLLDLLAERGIRGTFFVLGWVAEHHPDVVRRIAAAGHEVASHGYAHRLVYDQAPAEFREDVRRSKALLESLSGAPAAGYRAPSFSITTRSLWALDVLAEEGYAYDASIFPIRHDRYGIASAPRHPHVVDVEGGSIVEIPASTVRVGGVNLPIAGGGYFRLLPYGWTRWGISRVNGSERRPVIFYLHPWEVDPGQPRIAAPWLSRFRHYRNLHRTESRLRRLIAEFAFGRLDETVVAGVNTAPAASPSAAALQPRTS